MWYMCVYRILNIFLLFLHLVLSQVKSLSLELAPAFLARLVGSRVLSRALLPPVPQCWVTVARPSPLYAGARDQSRARAVWQHFTHRASSAALCPSVCLLETRSWCASGWSELTCIQGWPQHTLTLLSLPPKGWDCRCVPPCSGTSKIFEVSANNL